MRIGLLTRPEARIRQGVLPTEIVPVVDRHAQGDDRWIASEFADQLVSGRTRRAALRCKKLHHRTRLGMGGSYNCNHGSYDCSHQKGDKRVRPSHNTTTVHCRRPAADPDMSVAPPLLRFSCGTSPVPAS